MKKLSQEVPEILQDFVDNFHHNSVMNKENCQHIIDMYWRSKLINNGQDSDLCTGRKQI